MSFVSAARLSWLIAAVIAMLTAVTVVTAQNDWAYFGQDQGGTKYSTLAQINTSNVSSLRRAWTFHTGDKSGFFESTPIVVESVLYFGAQNGFYALDAVTGQQIWKFDARQTTRRGVSYWPGDARTAARIFASTGTKLVALEAKTGKPAESFGDHGFVDMQATMASPPTIYRNLVITSASKPIVRAWDARTGALAWTFNLVAQPGDPAHGSWESDAWRTTGGTNVWGLMTVDTQRGLVYVPNSIAGNDYVGAERPGNNLYGTSLVAIDANTGRLKWYQQFVRHDIWDYDLGAAPTLYPVKRGNRVTYAVAQMSKMGLLFTFDRLTGRPLTDIEDRAVPQSTVPGEKTSPTQPIPFKPPPLARNSMTRAELATVTPELKAYCEGLWDKYGLQDSGPYTPWQLAKDIVLFPGALGGGNWQGVTFNEKRGLLITNVMNAGQWGHLEKVDPDAPRGRGGRGGDRGGGDGAEGGRGAAPEADSAGPPPAYRKVTPEGGRFWQPDTKYSCAQPPWGELIAVNSTTADIAWRVPLGTFEELESKGIPRTGTPNVGGAMSTAGDLVFIGATIDGYFRAFDARNGKELWSEKLVAPAHSIPSTYMGKNGKQYVAVAAGGGGYLNSPRSDELIAWTLP